MTRSKEAGKPFYVYLPYTQVHNPPIPDPEYAGKTKRGNWADILTQMDDFTGVILDKLDELGHRRGHDRRVGVRQRRRPDVPHPGDRPGPGRAVSGTGSPARGGAACSPRSRARTGRRASSAGRGRCPPARSATSSCTRSTSSPTLVKAGGGKVPDDRQIDGMDMTDFLLGDAEESGRDTVLCLQGNRLQAAKWHQWKVHLFKQDDFYSTWVAVQHAASLQPRVGPARGAPGRLPARLGDWHPVAAAAAAFLKTLVAEPPIKPGTPDPYTPPKPGECKPADAPADRADRPVRHHARRGSTTSCPIPATASNARAG